MKKTKKGFTLVEMIIASALLAVALSLFVSTFVSAKKSAVFSSRKITMLNAARGELEQLVAKNYTDPELNIMNHSAVKSDYRFEYVVTRNAAFPNVKDIHLTLYWKNPITTVTSTVSLATSVGTAIH
ncbi:MAG: type II secretion system protein [Lentisphaerae bacterium]|jgi:prepilin-type N-terminal cleavage/methylation domain-containing protein|nr:type II secretion system protein [Lentisphaerota bacterium]